MEISLNRTPVAFLGDLQGSLDSLVRILPLLQGRLKVFLGDTCDRGPESLACIRIVRNLCMSGQAMCVMGNHEYKLIRFLQGQRQTPSDPETIRQLRTCSQEELDGILNWLQSLPGCIITENWIAVHGAFRKGLSGGKARSLYLYGETTGKNDADGYPERIYNWRDEWLADPSNKQSIFHGHACLMSNRVACHTNEDGSVVVVNCDTGACHGYPLTAVLYPELQILQVEGQKQRKVDNDSEIGRRLPDGLPNGTPG